MQKISLLLLSFISISACCSLFISCQFCSLLDFHLSPLFFVAGCFLRQMPYLRDGR